MELSLCENQRKALLFCSTKEGVFLLQEKLRQLWGAEFSPLYVPINTSKEEMGYINTTVGKGSCPFSGLLIDYIMGKPYYEA